MKITFENCGGVKKSEIKIIEGSLNIKYGLNGIGKTTLGKSLFASCFNDSELLSRYKSFDGHTTPTVQQNQFKNPLYFDREYVDKYLFKEDILNNTFEIVIKTPDYEKRKSEIDDSFSDLMNLVNSPILEKVFSDISQIVDAIKLNKNLSDVVATSSFAKGLDMVNVEKKIGNEVEGYKKLITSPKNGEWIDWFKKGDTYIIDEQCPFCLEKIKSTFRGQQKVLNETFDKNIIKNSVYSNQTLELVKKLASDDVKASIANDQTKGSISEGSMNHIISLRGLFEIENKKFRNLKGINPFDFVNSGEIDINIFLKSYKLNELLFKEISEEVYELIVQTNLKLDEYTAEVKELNNRLGQLKATLSRNIKALHKNINNFMKIAGIPYEITTKMIKEGDCKTILKPISVNVEISEPVKTLSYGEINAISLMLFSVEAINSSSDLIILDDPVSSFDETKKYAIIYHLFSSSVRGNLRGRTTLLFTHDFNPIIDFVYNGLPTRGEIFSTYLYKTKDGVMEKEICKNDILSVVEVELTSAQNISKNIISRVVHLRNYYDLLCLYKSPEYNILSSLIHIKEKACNLSGEGLDEKELSSGLEEIRKIICDFDYNYVLSILKSASNIKELYERGNSIDKIVAARLLMIQEPQKKEEKVLWKYISEFFHIQNQLIFILNPESFEMIPMHMLESCEKLFNNE